MTSPPPNNSTDLYEINEGIAQTLIPAMAYVGFMMLFGVLGNVLVCFVFIKKMKRGTQNFLITSLAVFDLLSSLLAMPVEIADMRYYYTFHSEVACKLLRFINALCCLSSIVTLLAIAIDRYLKVCRPLETQMKLRQAKLSVGVAVCAGLAFSWPALVIYGIRTVQTEVVGVLGKDCSTSDSMIDTLYPLVYHAVLAVGFIAFTVALIVLYGLICVSAKKHKRYMARTSDIGKSISGKKHTSMSSLECSTSNARLSDIDDVQPQLSKDSTKRETTLRRRRMKDKTTVIGFVVTLVFVLSFLPFLSLVGARSVFKNFDYDLKGAAMVAFNVFIRSYFVNSAANPIIYGVLNVRFRQESIVLFKRMMCCAKFQSSSLQQTSSQ
ncbi:orexin receptor type 1-like [Gigantopelta aegis]|uniref:orexin receptor type 1-like n=1 Tax=Gigantopelta aegis TaxID=1735272 RepID=UPI001B88C0C1|nr:orexin receptor type 1-like [Gigantopelta aegis]